MRKRLVHIFTILMLALFLTSCAAEPAVPATVPAESTVPTETHTHTEQTIPVQTLPATVPTETEPPAGDSLPMGSLPTVPAEAPVDDASPVPGITSAAETELPYLQRIERSDHAIYGGPGYDCGFVDTIRRGTYTIVSEAVDHEGNLWGELKSGIGWVNLTEIQSGDFEGTLISAGYADDKLVRHGAYHHCPSSQEYAIPVVIRAYGKLRDVTLFDIRFNAQGYFPGEDFFTLPEMTEDMPLVAELDFPGDMTMYGIRFTDEAGAAHIYSIYISGRTGALVLNKE